jgi:acyl carrier protein
MERNEIIHQVENIFRDVFENEKIHLTNETRPNEIEEWDSLTHILLVDAMEKCFGIRFKSEEIFEWENVGAIIDSIQTK